MSSSERIDIDKRRAALKEIDDAKFGWRHILACLVAGTGFFMDAYDLFAINLASLMLGYVYFHDQNDTVPVNTDLSLKVSAACGTFVGQLAFGYLADRLGRKRMYGFELIIIIVATIGTALAGNGPAISLIGTIVFWRAIMGIGIGGDYPLSAIITSEFATKKRRGAMMGAVFAMQGFGIFFSAIVSLIVMASFKHLIIDPNSTNVDESREYIDYCWRLLLGIGAVPGGAALYFRLTIPETPRYTMDVERNYSKANADISTYLQQTNSSRDLEGQGSQVSLPKATWSDFFSYFGQWKNGKILLGTSVSWFCLDVAFYGMGLNNGTILTATGFPTDHNQDHNNGAYNTLLGASIGNVIITLLGTIPGYWVTVIFIDRWGRKPIQIMGFAVLTVIFFIMGGLYDSLMAQTNKAGFIALFTLAQFFQNFGPNTTTFIVPGEVFPTRYRSTGHGISAASGKLGAIVAQVGFAQLKYSHPKDYVRLLLLVFGAFMFLGLLSSFLIPETKGLSLEELSNEEDYYVEEKKERVKSET